MSYFIGGANWPLVNSAATIPSHKMTGGCTKASHQGKVAKVMHEWKRGKLHSTSKTGPMVTKRKQAVAIAMSEARKAGQLKGRKKGKK